jgi:hypothetical protein
MRTTLPHLFVMALFVALAGCGDSTGGSAGTCTDGTKSMDPCPQTGTMCAGVGGVAVACCVGGQFEQQVDMMSGRMTTKCQCEQASQGIVVQCAGGGAGGTSGGSGGANCGNGRLDSGEQCDGTNLNGASCTSMSMGSGMLQCSAACMYNTAMCSGGGGSGGTGGGGSGG